MLSPQAAIMVVFFVQAFAGGGLFPRIPDIQVALDLTEGELGLVMMGQPIGALTSFVFASFIIERIGPKPLLAACIPLIAVATVLLALSDSGAVAFVVMLGYGLSFALANVAMNVEADRVEAATGRRVMSRCHGMWSLGFLAASLLGAAARGIPAPPLLHFALVAPAVLAIAAAVIWPMRASPPRAHTGTARKKVFVLPRRATFLLVGVILSGIMVDATVRTWSVIFMRDTFAAADWVDALTLPAFLLTLSAGRMVGDRLADRFGPVRLAAGLLAVALAGLALVLASQNLAVALAGFAALGIGVSVVYPLTISAAARLGDRPASENVTSITMVSSLIMLGVPTLMGFVAESFGIRMTFAVLLPILLLALALTRQLSPRPVSASGAADTAVGR
ncbi:MAG: MFS transporter [Alphaproteobacteria bacterium]